MGGRLTETYADGSVFVIGVISVWEPPRRLVVSWCQASFPLAAFQPRLARRWRALLVEEFAPSGSGTAGAGQR